MTSGVVGSSPAEDDEVSSSSSRGLPCAEGRHDRALQQEDVKSRARSYGVGRKQTRALLGGRGSLLGIRMDKDLLNEPQ